MCTCTDTHACPHRHMHAHALTLTKYYMCTHTHTHMHIHTHTHIVLQKHMHTNLRTSHAHTHRLTLTLTLTSYSFCSRYVPSGSESVWFYFLTCRGNESSIPECRSYGFNITTRFSYFYESFCRGRIGPFSVQCYQDQLGEGNFVLAFWLEYLVSTNPTPLSNKDLKLKLTRLTYTKFIVCFHALHHTRFSFCM